MLLGRSDLELLGETTEGLVWYTAMMLARESSSPAGISGRSALTDPAIMLFEGHMHLLLFGKFEGLSKH